MQGDLIGSQLKAARKLRGVKNAQVLADMLNKPRFGDKVIGMIERDERRAQAHEIEWIAGALDLPTSFFTEPVSAPAETSMVDVLAAINAQLAEQTQVLNEVKAVLVEVRALLGKDTATADRMEAVSDALDDAVQEAIRGLGASAPRTPRAAAKNAKSRSPQAST